jgi:hypothetical protein
MIEEYNEISNNFIETINPGNFFCVRILLESLHQWSEFNLTHSSLIPSCSILKLIFTNTQWITTTFWTKATFLSPKCCRCTHVWPQSQTSMLTALYLLCHYLKPKSKRANKAIPNVCAKLLSKRDLSVLLYKRLSYSMSPFSDISLLDIQTVVIILYSFSFVGLAVYMIQMRRYIS